MTATTTRVVLAQRPEGEATPECFRVETETLDQVDEAYKKYKDLKDGANADYFQRRGRVQTEFYTLALFAVLGMMVASRMQDKDHHNIAVIGDRMVEATYVRALSAQGVAPGFTFAKDATLAGLSAARANLEAIAI